MNEKTHTQPGSEVEPNGRKPFVEPCVSAPEDVLRGNPSVSSMFAVATSTGDSPTD